MKHKRAKDLHPRSLLGLTRHLQGLIQGKLWVKILVGMVLGLGVGVLLSPDTGLVDPQTSKVIGSWLALPGNVFLGLIQMIVIPLVVASIIGGMASADSTEHLRKLGTRLVFYFVATTILAVIIGLGVTLLVKPGHLIDQSLLSSLGDGLEEGPGKEDLQGPPALPDIVVSLLPENPLGAMVEREMLQVVLFSIIIGLALVTIAQDQAQPLLRLLESLQEVCMAVVRWAMLLAPLAVFGLLAQITMKVGFDALLGMAAYVGTVLLGLLLLLLTYLVIVLLVARENPLQFLKDVSEVQLLAFSTSSSAAVMPLSMKTAREKLKVPASIAEFVIPLGATVNMDGTALYQGAATLFLAQVFGMELGLPSLVLIVITTVAASIGSPATPGVGIVVLAMVLKSVGIPTSGIALILGVDRILDMCRTATNVTGDLAACLVMNRWIGSDK